MSSPSTPSTYHQQVQESKRAAIIAAATELFLNEGYAGTSLAKVAKAAEVSTATLFKRFPTKAALFDAIVTEYWEIEQPATAMPKPGNPRKGLTLIAKHYISLLTRPEMVSLFRLVIAETPRFPELAKAHFALGKAPFFESVRQYLLAEEAAGTLSIPDSQLAATHFLGMVSNYAFWPRLLLPNWSPSQSAQQKAVDEAVTTLLARYATESNK